MRTSLPFRAVLLALLIKTFAAEAASSPLLIPQPEQSFGTVRQGDTVELRYAVRNQSAERVNLRRAEISQPGIRIRLPGQLDPGRESEIPLEWNTAVLGGKVEATILLYGGDDNKEPLGRLTASGTVTPRVIVAPLSAVFTSSFRGEGTERVLDIINKDETPLLIERIEPRGEHFVASVETVEQGKRYRLKVTVPPNTPTGRYREGVILHTGNAKVPHIPIPVNVLVKDDLYVNRETVDFGPIDAQDVTNNPGTRDLLKQTILLKKREGDFALTGVETSLPGITLSQDPAGRSSAFRVDVGLDLDKLGRGPFEGQILIRTDDAKFTEFKLPVRGTIR